METSSKTARQLYQDFRVPMRPSAATFSFEHFQAGFDVSQDLDPEDVLTIEKDPLNEGGDTPDNAYRIDLVDPAGPLFYEPILYPVHSPDALPIGAMGALVPVTNDRPDLLVFLAAHQGQMIRLRIGHVESTFPWQNGIDDVSLVVVSQ